MTGGKKKVIQISTEERSGLLLIYMFTEKLKKNQYGGVSIVDRI